MSTIRNKSFFPRVAKKSQETFKLGIKSGLRFFGKVVGRYLPVPNSLHTGTEDRYGTVTTCFKNRSRC